MTLQYMDKQALPAASILGIIQDLVSDSLHLLHLKLRCSSNLSIEYVGWSILMGQFDLLVRVPRLHLLYTISDGAPAYRQGPRMHHVSLA